MPLLYPEKSFTWEARIYNAFDEACIDIGTWFADMSNDRKAVYGTGAGGWFWNEGEKKIFLMFIILKVYPILIKKENTSTLR
jgi:hypothetical protein